MGPYLDPRALAIAQGQVQDDGVIHRALFVCHGHRKGPGLMAMALAMAMATAMALSVDPSTCNCRLICCHAG